MNIFNVLAYCKNLSSFGNKLPQPLIVTIQVILVSEIVG